MTTTQLTPKQAEVASMASQGMLNKQIAYDLNLTESAVKQHMTKIFKRLNVPNRTALAIRMLQTAALILVSAVMAAQTPGTVTVSTTVTASAGTMSCVMSVPAPPAVHMVCSSSGTVVLTQDSTPAVGATNGAVGNLTLSGNAITWVIQQPTTNNITWQISANGTNKTGTF